MNISSLVPKELRTATSTFLDRYRFFREAGITFGGKRDLYDTLGYDREITYSQYRARYERGGVAGRIIDAIPNATWRGDMWLEEDENPKVETPFEQAWNALEGRLKIKAVLQRVDILSRIGSYAVLLIGAPGEFNTELPKGKPESLLYLTPFSGGGGPGNIARFGRAVGDSAADATIQSFVTNTGDPRFGLPEFYQLRRLDVSDPQLMVPIHWSRVLHIAEGCLDSQVYGTPALQRSWNDLDNLEKVVGGGSESFWLRANQGINLNLEDTMRDFGPEQKEALKDEVDQYIHGISRVLKTRGMDVRMLGSDVANFQSPADAILTLIAGATGIPKRILTGSEMGELASTQDRSNFRDIVNGRQTGYVGPYVVRPLVDRLIQYGYLPTPKLYVVRWPHIEVLTDTEKAEGASKWASVNATAGRTVFTEDEIRDKWYGMEPSKLEDDEAWRADLAVKMATANKTQGTTLFTDDEIRKVSYGWKPLAEEDKKPITAPGASSVPNTDLAADMKPVVPGALKPKPAFPKAASAYSKASIQIQLPPNVATDLATFPINVVDLTEKGRETDPHITVKYGLSDAQTSADVAALLANQGPITVTLGKTGCWTNADGIDVVFVTVDSEDLIRLNALITETFELDETYAFFAPHATIAYVKQGEGLKYVGNDYFVGERFTTDFVTFSSVDDVRTSIRVAEDGDAELIKVLESAIREGATEVIDEILGLHTGASRKV